MLRCKISEGLQVTSFSRVATDELQASIHEIQQQNPRWEAFEEKLKTVFAVGDSSKATRRGFEDWVETPDKGLKVADVFFPHSRPGLEDCLRETKLFSVRTRWSCSYRP
jgi:hypothetical protein